MIIVPEKRLFAIATAALVAISAVNVTAVQSGTRQTPNCRLNVSETPLYNAADLVKRCMTIELLGDQGVPVMEFQPRNERQPIQQNYVKTGAGARDAAAVLEQYLIAQRNWLGDGTKQIEPRITASKPRVLGSGHLYKFHFPGTAEIVNHLPLVHIIAALIMAHPQVVVRISVGNEQDAIRMWGNHASRELLLNVANDAIGHVVLPTLLEAAGQTFESVHATLGTGAGQQHFHITAMTQLFQKGLRLKSLTALPAGRVKADMVLDPEYNDIDAMPLLERVLNTDFAVSTTRPQAQGATVIVKLRDGTLDISASGDLYEYLPLLYSLLAPIDKDFISATQIQLQFAPTRGPYPERQHYQEQDVQVVLVARDAAERAIVHAMLGAAMALRDHGKLVDLDAPDKEKPLAIREALLVSHENQITLQQAAKFMGQLQDVPAYEIYLLNNGNELWSYLKLERTNKVLSLWQRGHIGKWQETMENLLANVSVGDQGLFHEISVNLQGPNESPVEKRISTPEQLARAAEFLAEAAKHVLQADAAPLVAHAQQKVVPESAALRSRSFKWNVLEASA